MNFMSFGDFYIAEGLFRKTTSGPLSYSPNKQTDVKINIPRWHRLKKDLEDMRR
jgi:hypothetical protein